MISWHRLWLYINTMRYLKPSQVWRRIPFMLIRPRPDLRPAPVVRPRSGPWQQPAEREPSLIAPHRFRFLGVEHDLPRGSVWDPAGLPRLWIYNLHYFDDLNAVDHRRRASLHRTLVNRWIAENPPGEGPGWEPYPLSLRIVNWIKWILAGNPSEDGMLGSLAVQARYLARRLEHHLLGNHLFVNAKALVFAGAFFGGDEGKAWMARGMQELLREIPEQILADGGHFERSTMYHALAYEDMLDLTNLARAYPEAFTPHGPTLFDWPAILERMGRWLKALCHPDGQIAFFNDAALGVAPAPETLFAYADALGFPAQDPGPGIVHLEASGYVRMAAGDAVLLADVAPVGPDYLPGHAHADTLSFELSLAGQRIVVNGGTSTYDTGPAREAERGTPAHSTLAIGGLNSSEVWASFRVARRARPFDVKARREGGCLVLEAAHDGYRSRFPGRPVHRRRWRLWDGGLEVRDAVLGDFPDASARFHFHPKVGVAAESSRGGIWWGCRSASWEAEAFGVRLEESSWHPGFGSTLPTSCLRLELDSAAGFSGCVLTMEWL